ncbi:MAG: SufE family protein [Bacteroidota bacterium]
MAHPATAQARAQEIVEDFALFDDWMGRYEYLIDLGRDLPLIDPQHKTEAYRIHGCQAQVWLHADTDDGLVHYTADSDALITKGLIALLLRVLSGLPADEIRHADLAFLDEIGLREHLSATRKNGLASMVSTMKAHAKAHAAL